MRVDIFQNGYEVSEMLRTYAESRVWLAVNRAADQLSWVGVRLMGDDDQALRDRVVCQLDVWLRGIGLVTVRHVDVNPYVAIDRASARLEQTVDRKLREVGRRLVESEELPVETASAC
jgi:ribosome-associated translation inhibitor RaiA